MKFSSSALRRWSRTLHRDLSYFFAGMVLIYALSGIVMNHRDTFNPNYSVSRTELVLAAPLPVKGAFSRADAEALLEREGVEEAYVKHYFPDEQTLKIFLKGGSSFVADLRSGEAVVEHLTRRPVWSALTRLHYNPGSWWTVFADIFGGGLILITLTGLVLVKGPKGLWGRGGVELAAGILIPLQMAGQTWDDHDRRGRTVCRDYAMNILSSVDQNSILFISGDNNSFPVWYIQDTEGFRTDVRTLNTDYLSSDWYIMQAHYPYFEAPPIPMIAAPDT